VTDAQIFTLALAVIVPLSLLLYSNSRITETKETLRAEMKLLESQLNLKFAAVMGSLDRIEAAVKGAEERLEMKLHVHELEHHRE
jgi:hypothetical protein